MRPPIPEIKRTLLGADVKLTQGTARVLLKMPAKERKAAVDQLVEKGELPRANKAAAPARKAKEIAQSMVSRLQVKGEAHARSVVQQMARLAFCSEKGGVSGLEPCDANATVTSGLLRTGLQLASKDQTATPSSGVFSKLSRR
jgi:hypothetical protein